MTPVAPVPKPVPIVWFDQATALREFPELVTHVASAAEAGRAIRLSDLLIGFYELPRGAVFFPVPSVKQPFAFRVPSPDTPSGRTHAVVARELGDLAYPAHLANQRAQVGADVTRAVVKTLGDVKDWLRPGWRTWHTARRFA